MSRSESGNCKVLEKFYVENVEGILERHWSRKKSYVIKWKQLGNFHILMTG